MDKWQGKIALVTGSSAGIGAALTVALANSGMIVIGLARRVDAVQDLAKALNPDASGKIIAKKCDVTNESEVLSVFDWIRADYGHLDVFVNNAGIIKADFFLDGNMADFRHIFDVNVLAACQCIRESVKLMKANGSYGHVIVINSVLGHRIPDVPVPLFNVYPASKFALTALIQVIRSELAYQQANIKLTSISPGMVDTEFVSALVADPMMRDQLPKLKTSDVTAAVLYALSTPERTQVEEIVLQATSPHQ